MSISDWLSRALHNLKEASRFVDGLDVIEFVTAVEETFNVPIPDETSEKLSTPGQLCDWLSVRVEGKAPGKRARKLLKAIAERERKQELVPTGGSNWSLEQIQAVVLQLVRDWANANDATLESSFRNEIFH